MILLRLAALALAVATAWSAEDVRIALLCTGSTTDGGWNQLAKEGAEAAAAKIGAKLTILQKVPQDRASSEIFDFVAEDYRLVIAHGYEYLEPAAKVAAEIGEGAVTRIAVCGADVARPGIVTIDFDVSHASYQAGIVAARVSKSGKLGFIGGAPIPSVKACYRGFLAGARSINPDINVAETYTSWDQPQQNKAQTEALLQVGVDVVYHDVDAASLGVFEAIRAANQAKPGSAWVVGCVADQNANPICPEWILGSAVIRLDDTFAVLAASVMDGSFTPGAVVRENIARKTCVFIPNPTLVGTVITPGIQAELATAETGLIAGDIVIPGEP